MSLAHQRQVLLLFAGRDTTGYGPKQVEAFNKANPGLQLDYQEQGANTTDRHDKFVTVAGAKDPSVDIASMDVPFVPEFAAAGWTIPVEPLLENLRNHPRFPEILQTLETRAR